MDDGGDVAVFSDDSEVLECTEQKIEDDQWNNDYALNVNDDTMSKKEKEESEEDIDSSSSESDVSIAYDDDEENDDTETVDNGMPAQLTALVVLRSGS